MRNSKHNTVSRGKVSEDRDSFVLQVSFNLVRKTRVVNIRSLLIHLDFILLSCASRAPDRLVHPLVF